MDEREDIPRSFLTEDSKLADPITSSDPESLDFYRYSLLFYLNKMFKH